MLLRDYRAHGQGGAGLPLTFGAMTGINHRGLSGDLVADRAALAIAGLGKAHRPSSCNESFISGGVAPCGRGIKSIAAVADGKPAIYG
jgi:hypothetical protein